MIQRISLATHFSSVPQKKKIFVPLTRSLAQIIQKNKNYCNNDPTNQNYATARSSCCYSCAMNLGFTTQKPSRKIQSNGSYLTIYITVIDLTGPAAMRWSALPTVNAIYPGLDKSKTNDLCKDRSARFGLVRFCADPLSRIVCGETCKTFNLSG